MQNRHCTPITCNVDGSRWHTMRTYLIQWPGGWNLMGFFLLSLGGWLPTGFPFHSIRCRSRAGRSLHPTPCNLIIKNTPPPGNTPCRILIPLFRWFMYSIFFTQWSSISFFLMILDTNPYSYEAWVYLLFEHSQGRTRYPRRRSNLECATDS